jgi:peptidoglycan/xylan/chitin deacetylase (PgdA/CDA1 family)
MTLRRSCILTYHSLDTSGSVISIAPTVFQEHMACLAEAGVPVVSLDRVRETPGAVALTFDDAFRNFFEHAAPVLQRHSFPATVFPVSSFCGGRNDWPSQPKNTGVPVLELMRWDELRQVARAGISVGCHTATHPPLSSLSNEKLEEELRSSRSAIEDQVGVPVDTFAYPYGDSDPRVQQAASRHFRLACGTKLGFLSPSSGVLDLPRLDIYYIQRRFWFRGFAKPYGRAYLTARGLARSLRHRLSTGYGSVLA